MKRIRNTVYTGMIGVPLETLLQYRRPTGTMKVVKCFELVEPYLV